MAKKFVNPAEAAYKAGRSKVTMEEAVGIPKKPLIDEKKKKKKSKLKRIIKAIRMGILGKKHRTEFMKRKGLYPQ